MKKGLIIALSVVFAVVLVFGCLYLFIYRNYIKAFQWDYHESMNDNEKERLSNIALMPDMADSFENYAVMGFRDPSYLIITKGYKSLDDMCASFPEGYESAFRDAYNRGAMKTSEDVIGNEVTRYEIDQSLMPLISEKDVDSRFRGAATGAFRYYYVLEYPDGTFRFAARVDTI